MISQPAAADGRIDVTVPGERRVVLAAYAIGLLAAGSLGHFLLGLPIQVSDSFGHMLQLTVSWPALLAERFGQDGYLRPAMWIEMKTIYELAGGNYTPWFRWTHVMQVATLTALFVALVRPRSWRDLACLPFALAVLFGVHTFTGTVVEAFPVNTYMTMLLLCAAAAVVALKRPAWWNDAAAVVLFVVAALTVETGLLVWVIVAGAALTGATGVSRRGVVAVTVLLAAYMGLRFLVLDTGVPGLVERSSGFGFGVLDPPELIERFGANPLPFYAYNVAASISSVLFSEPSNGVFRLTERLTAGEVPPYMLVNAIASAGLAALLALFAWTRRQAWRARRFEHDDRLVLLFAMVLVANAAIGYAYTKDVIMSPAGVFLAAAAYAAVRHLLMRVPPGAAGVRAVAVVAVVAIVGSAWSLRLVGLHTRLRQAAVTERLDWAYVESDVASGRVTARDAGARALLEALRHDALVARPAPPALRLPLQRFLGE